VTTAEFIASFVGSSVACYWVGYFVGRASTKRTHGKLTE
jgi:membrane protein DedA with SNARE-associated domain